MFTIIYMDFLDVPRPLNSEHRIVYSLPRAYFVCDADFKLVAEIDRNGLIPNKIDFGKCNQKEMEVEPNSGPRIHKKMVIKRVAQSPEVVPKMKKIKVDAHGDALHQQYVMNRYSLKKLEKGETHPDFIEIDGFHTSLKNFHASLKPRAEIVNEVQLGVDPDVFDPKTCEKEFRKACEMNSISNTYLLFFTVVNNRHWAVVVVNIPRKQFNVFDSIKNAKDEGLLEKTTKNVRVASREPLFKHDLESFKVFTPDDYPQQLTYYDCGFYSILYGEKWNGVFMASFDKEYIPKLHKCMTADL